MSSRRRGFKAMANMNMIQALNSAMDIMLGRDPSVVLMGEDIGYFGGVFRNTEGLQRKYCEQRWIDTPIAEGGIVAVVVVGLDQIPDGVAEDAVPAFLF